MAANELNDLAQIRIEAAIKEGAEMLDLSGLRLKIFPTFSGQLPQLRTLDLSANHLKSLPPDFAQNISMIRTLNLSGNQIEDLPRSMVDLSHLSKLDISGNQLVELPEPISRLSDLRTLYLADNQLKSLPEAIGGLSKLQALGLYGNRLREVPGSVGRLASLRKLYLSGNLLRSLPGSFAQLLGLRELYLHGNGALGIPPEVLGPRWEDVFFEGKSAARPVEILQYYFSNQQPKAARLRPNESDTRLKIFLCHASDDKSDVRDLYRRLREDGADPWLDEENLLPGQYWESEVKRSLRNSHVVIACLSEKAIRKTGFVQKEIKVALDFLDNQPEGVIYFVPIMLESCELPRRLRHLHAVRLYRDGGYEKLLSALNSRAKDLDLDSLVNKQNQMGNRLRMLRQKPQSLQEPYK